jgi:hypothetical protein
MVIPRTKFFLALFLLLFAPLVLYKVIWLMQSQKVNGIFAFEGQGNALDQMRFPFSEIYFINENDTVWFKGPGGLHLKPGDVVPLRYLSSNPSNAKIDNFKALWGATVIYGGIPFLVLFVIFLHPEIVPYRSNVELTRRKPFLRVV